MPTLFVLDVNEFRPLVEAARKRGGISIDGPKAGYYRLSTDGDLTMDRADTGMIEAVWFGAFTAGFKGATLEVDSTRFRIAS
jgi:hypothetical protein